MYINASMQYHYSCLEGKEWQIKNSLLSRISRISDTLINGFPDFAQVIFGHIDITAPS
jgi:hypothetical protein